MDTASPGKGAPIREAKAGGNIPRAALAPLIIFALIGSALLAGGARELPNLHTILDTSMCLFSAILARLFWDMGAEVRLKKFLAITFVATCALECAHIFASIDWPALSPAAQLSANLRPLTWGPAALMVPIGIGGALWLSDRSPRSTLWFAIAIALASLTLLALYQRVTPYAPADALGITHPSLIAVPLLWSVVTWKCWRSRVADRIVPTLGIVSVAIMLASVAMLYSQAPGDAWAIVAHMGRAAGYLTLLIALMHMASLDMVERLWIQTYLAQTEARYRGLLEAAPDAMVVVNQRGEIVLLNLQAEKQFGYKQDELLGQQVKSIIPHGFAERLITDGKRSATEALAQQIGTGIELVALRKDGSEFPIELMLSPLENSEGVLVTAAIRDIAVRKDAEDHLAQMEARYRGLLEAAPDAMIVVNERGEIVLLNLQAEKQFGYKQDELLGQQVKNIIPRGFAERLITDGKRSAAEALAQQIGTGIELVALRKDGSEFPIELMLSPLENSEGILVTAAIRDITVRKDAEDHLVHMEARYRGLLEAAPDAMVVVNDRGEIVLLNLQAEQRFGYHRDELLGQKVTNIIPRGFAERLIADGERSAAEALAQQIGTGIELVALRKDGSEFPIELMLSPLENAEGNLVTAAIRDVTVRQAAQEALRASEEWHRMAVEVTEMGTWIWKIAPDEITWSAQFQKMFGLSSNAVLTYDEIVQNIHADDRAGLNESVRASLEDGAPYDVEYRVIWPDQSVRWIASRGRVDRDAAGVPISMRGTLLDMTEHKAGVEALRVSEEWHRMAVEVTDMGTWVVNLNPDEITWSDHFAKIMGLPAGGTRTYEAIFEVIHPDDRQRVDESVKHAIAHDLHYEAEFRVIWPDLSVHWVASNGRVVRREDGTAVSLRGAALDVTARKAAYLALAERAVMERTALDLTRSNDELQQFAYIAAHDLQEPLRMVSSYTQLLADRYKGQLDARADEFIAYAVDGATRMQLLITDLLAYCRIETAGQEFRETSSELALGDALLNLQGALGECGGVVTHDQLPLVTVDRAQLAQLFQNIIGNALKYRGVDRPRVHVSVVKNAAREWIFAVRDNGLGIEPQYFEKIFVMFQRLHGRTEFSGTGIGLSLCKKIAERHGGRMWVDSIVGAGSTFYLSLPERAAA